MGAEQGAEVERFVFEKGPGGMKRFSIINDFEDIGAKFRLRGFFAALELEDLLQGGLGAFDFGGEHGLVGGERGKQDGRVGDVAQHTVVVGDGAVGFAQG